MMQLDSVLVSGAQPNVLSKEIDSFNFMIPILVQEQQKIGSFFKQLDDTIALHQRKLDLLKEQKKGFLQKMFPKNGAKVPELRFAGFADDWEQRKLGDMASIGSGRDYKHLSSGNIPVYGTGGYMLSVNEYLSDKDAIGIGRKGTIDKPYILNAPFWTVDTLFFVVPKNQVDLQYLFSVFQKIYWKKYDESTGVPSLSKQSINNITIYSAFYEEQKRIGKFVGKLEDLITLHQRKLDLLKETKKGFLQKMFPKNGAKVPEIRFPGFTEDWEERKLGDIAPLRGGFAFKSSKFRNTGVPIVRISNILSSGEVGGDFAYYDEQDKDDKYILPDKSAVLAMSGATTGKE